jgi:predicted nuclease with TOPRIM domain
MPGEGPENESQQYAIVAEIRAYAQTEFRRLREEVNRIFDIIDDMRSKDSASAERLANLRSTVDAVLQRLQKIEQETSGGIDLQTVESLISAAINAALQKQELEDLRNKLENVDSSPEQVTKRLDRELIELKQKFDALNTEHTALKVSHSKLRASFGGLKLKFTLLVAGIGLVGAKLIDLASSYFSNLISK